MNTVKRLFFAIVFFVGLTLHAQKTREHLLINDNWKFALGHADLTEQDFNHAEGYFSHFAKTGFGDGPAAQGFDDRSWRVLDLPHDWCVELPFAADGSHSHGYKAMGRKYPENSIGWYRKSFNIPEEDLGKKISIEFDGVFRNSSVWVNGFYAGTAQSGYHSFEYDVTDYINYGGENVVAVRADAEMEEGWYYEGAGIYRNVYLNKKHPIHIARNGSYVNAQVVNNTAQIAIQTTIENTTPEAADITLTHTLFDAQGNKVGTKQSELINIQGIGSIQNSVMATVPNPKLWTLENPHLYTVKTTVQQGNKTIDAYTTSFGVRSIRFDPDKGFFLNGKHLKIVGANNHKDHAGVGTALPVALIEWRIKQMQAMGANAIRTSHDPPAPEFLDACDRLGMLVMVENRLSGSSQYHFDYIKDLITQNRNHPSIIMWSLGNEEWAIEGSIKGVRITKSMQEFAAKYDTTRAYTVALSGGWDTGTGTISDVIGYNYIVHGDIDEHHKNYPWQPSIGTEETTTRGTRGVYETDKDKCHLAVDLTDPYKPGCEYGWNFYNDREFLSGIFFWTGFDYRGEPTPYKWPAVVSQFGIMDLCGFPKDPFYYLQSWWTKKPMVHFWPHWNWEGDEGKEKTVTVYSNCEEVELFLNKKSLGKKKMPRNGHLEWTVKYAPGTLTAKGYISGKEAAAKTVTTTGTTTQVVAEADRTTLKADNKDVAMITIKALDKKKRTVPTANIPLTFEIEGPGKIIGVGNGDPSSHEKERYLETITRHQIVGLKELTVDNLDNRKEVQFDVNDSSWKRFFDDRDKPWDLYEDTLIVIRGSFDIPEVKDNMTVNLFTKSIVENQSIYVNGHLIAPNVERDSPDQSYTLDHAILKKGKNVYAVTGQRFKKQTPWEEPNTDPGLVQLITPAEQWKRKTFNGLAQVIVQSTHEAGEIVLKVNGEGVKGVELEIRSSK